MNKRLALTVAVIMGLLAVFLVHLYIKNMRSVLMRGMDEVTVLVATHDLEKGTILTDQKVAYRKYPEKYVADRAIDPNAASAAMGAQLKVAVEKGKPIFWSDLITRAELSSGLAGDLQPNMCAMTIPVTQITGLAGLLAPGMCVDILLTTGAGCMRRPGSIASAPETPTPESFGSDVNALKAALTAPPKVVPSSGITDDKTKTTVMLLQDVLVLATGGLRIGVAPPAPVVDDQNMYNSVTVMLSRREAQILTHALTQGQINLLLRKTGETEKFSQLGPITCEDLRDFVLQNSGQ